MRRYLSTIYGWTDREIGSSLDLIQYRRDDLQKRIWQLTDNWNGWTKSENRKFRHRFCHSHSPAPPFPRSTGVTYHFCCGARSSGSQPTSRFPRPLVVRPPEWTEPDCGTRCRRARVRVHSVAKATPRDRQLRHRTVYCSRQNAAICSAYTKSNSRCLTIMFARGDRYKYHRMAYLLLSNTAIANTVILWAYSIYQNIFT